MSTVSLAIDFNFVIFSSFEKLLLKAAEAIFTVYWTKPFGSIEYDLFTNPNTKKKTIKKFIFFFKNMSF